MASPVLLSLAKSCSRIPTLFCVVRKSPWSCIDHPLAVRFQVPPCGAVVSRSMASHARKMTVQASRFNWTRFKNDAHFYFMLAALPLGSIIFYTNFFIGPAELAEIPDGYEPKTYEYYRHPIHRWLMKYLYDPPEKQYEMAACKFVDEFEQAKLRCWTRHVQGVMADKDDYRAWYFVPAVDPRSTEELKKRREYTEDFLEGGK